MVLSVTGSNPAKGTEWSHVVPAGKRWKIQSITLALTTGGAGSARRVYLLIKDAAGGNVLSVAFAPSTQATSLTYTYVFSPQDGGTVVDNRVWCALLRGLVLTEGMQLITSTTNFDTNVSTGDDWSSGDLLVEEFDESYRTVRV